jgi:hypothetical protein
VDNFGVLVTPGSGPGNTVSLASASANRAIANWEMLYATHRVVIDFKPRASLVSWCFGFGGISATLSRVECAAELPAGKRGCRSVKLVSINQASG